MRKQPRMAVAVAAVLTLSLIAARAAAQTTGPRLPPLLPESVYGPDLYRMHCAACHGRDGKGNGPAAPALKVAPPDLTILARRQNGVFPAQEVATIIRGTNTIPAHGSDEMPMWGVIFKALDPSDARTRTRIQNLVDYLSSIQQR